MFQDIEDIKKNVTTALNADGLEAIADSSEDIFERCDKGIQVGRDCSE
jgi:hypothetical protein